MNSINASTFDNVYNNNLWGDSHSKSGPGSNLEQTKVIRKEIPALLTRLTIKRMLDAPCGDFFWMNEIKGELNNILELYIGGDIVPDLIRTNNARFGDKKTKFEVLDITKDNLPKVDLIFSRDCFIHLPYRQIIAALEQFKKSGSTYLLTSTYTKDRPNKDTFEIFVDGRAINLERPPFNFPKPLLIINENCTEGNGEYDDKSLALWKLSSISVFNIKLYLWLSYRFPFALKMMRYVNRL